MSCSIYGLEISGFQDIRGTILRTLKRNAHLRKDVYIDVL